MSPARTLGLWSTVTLSLLLALSFGSASARAAAPRFVSGRTARTRLGSTLGEVARKHGLTLAELEHLLATDPTLHADADGDLVFLDPGERGASTAADSAAAPFPLEETFALHTDPGAERILYLDFDGGTYSGGAPPKSVILSPTQVTIPPFGGIKPFSAETLTKIQWIWKRVAEDYAPFRLDVTTEEPAEADLEDCTNTCGARISIGGEPAEIGQPDGVQGIAPLTGNPAFGVETLPSAFVFTAGPFTTDELQAANTISHESGHTFGLLHDGVEPFYPYEGSYYEGFGDWCPIMGECNSPLSQWSKGEYPDANNHEDDLATIAAIAPVRADDVPGTAPLGGAPDAVEQAGLIGDRDDTDTFAFDSGGGPSTFTVEGAAPSPNLDASLTLLNEDGAVLAAADDPDGLDATLARTLSPGRYLLRVDGVGDSNPLPGYSDYDSLGRYFITGSYTPPYNTLSVSRQGSGTGTVSSSPAGIDCGAVCSAAFSDDVLVQLTATPDAGSTFAGWSGACTGAGACSVPMTEARSLIATFDKQAALDQPTLVTAATAATPHATPTPGPAPQPAPILSGRARSKVTTLRVSCGNRACVVHITATVVRKRSKLGGLRAWKKHLPAGTMAKFKLKAGKQLLRKVAGEHDVKVKVHAVFIYPDGTHINRVQVLPVH